VPEVNDVERVFDEATTRAHVRSRAEIRKLVAGMDIIEPGLAWPPEWRPDPGDEIPANAVESYYCVVVARTARPAPAPPDRRPRYRPRPVPPLTTLGPNGPAACSCTTTRTGITGRRGIITPG